QGGRGHGRGARQRGAANLAQRAAARGHDPGAGGADHAGKGAGLQTAAVTQTATAAAPARIPARAALAQLVEQLPCKQQVVRSIRTGGTTSVPARSTPSTGVRT